MIQTLFTFTAYAGGPSSALPSRQFVRKLLQEAGEASRCVARDRGFVAFRLPSGALIAIHKIKASHDN